MTGPVLTVDLGNSACKLRLWDGATDTRPALLAAERFDSTDDARADLEDQVARFLSSRARAQVAVVSSVAAPALEQRWLASLRAAGITDVLESSDSGLEVRAREPSRVGRDRLFAARGAIEHAGESAIVLDAGTALTVDAVVLDHGLAAFLGGAIAPGPALLARALALGGARLFEVEPSPGVRALGRDSREAMLAGIVVGFHGAARELAQRVSAEAGLERAPLVITGGARRFLVQPPLDAEKRVLEIEDLVHVGLYAAWLDRAQARAPSFASSHWRIR